MTWIGKIKVQAKQEGNERRVLSLLFGGGQSCALHSFVSTGLSAHNAPPNMGIGLVHVRVLELTPPPQDAEHSVQLLQGVKPPFTMKGKREKQLTVDLWWRLHSTNFRVIFPENPGVVIDRKKVCSTNCIDFNKCKKLTWAGQRVTC